MCIRYLTAENSSFDTFGRGLTRSNVVQITANNIRCIPNIHDLKLLKTLVTISQNTLYPANIWVWRCIRTETSSWKASIIFFSAINDRILWFRTVAHLFDWIISQGVNATLREYTCNISYSYFITLYEAITTSHRCKWMVINRMERNRRAKSRTRKQWHFNEMDRSSVMEARGGFHTGGTYDSRIVTC